MDILQVLQVILDWLVVSLAVDGTQIAWAVGFSLPIIQFLKAQIEKEYWRIWKWDVKSASVVAALVGITLGAGAQAINLYADGVTWVELGTMLIGGIATWLTSAGVYKLGFKKDVA